MLKPWRSRRAQVAAVIYCLAGTATVYVSAMNRGSLDPPDVWAFVGLMVVTLAVGFLVGSWAALLLPVLVSVLTIPTGFYGPWVGGLIPAGPVAAAVGVGLRKAIDVTMRERVAPSASTLLLVMTYIGLAIALMTYLATLSGDEEGGEWLSITFVAAHCVFGLAIGKWRALLLVLLLPILAIPVPAPEEAYEPFPAWFAMVVIGAPAGAVSMAVGIALHRAFFRFRSRTS